jgi:tetratricopeptide (TPR) repeat protein
MTTGGRNQALASAIEAAGFSHKGFAAAVRALACQHGEVVACDHTSVKRWLAGGQPRGMTAHFIATVLSARLGRRLEPGDLGLEERGAPAVTLGLDYAPTTELAASTAAELALRDVGRDGALMSADVEPSAWECVIARWLVGRDALRGQPVGPRSATQADVDAVLATTEALSRLDYRFGGGQPRTLLTRYLCDEISPLLTGTSPTSPCGARFFSAVAALLRLIAWTAYDTGSHALAQRYFIQALRLSRAAGDDALGGRILAGMSHQATYLGHYRHAADLARAARLGAGASATPTAVSLFYAMEARALAAQQDEASCLDALRNADVSFGRRSPENDPEWLRYFDAAELAAEWAHCLRDLGRGRQAETYAQQSLDLSEDLYVRSLSFVRTVLATSYLQQGEVEHAVATAAAAAETIAGLRSNRCRHYLQAFAVQLVPYQRMPAVEVFTRQLALMTAA